MPSAAHNRSRAARPGSLPFEGSSATANGEATVGVARREAQTLTILAAQADPCGMGISWNSTAREATANPRELATEVDKAGLETQAGVGPYFLMSPGDYWTAVCAGRLRFPAGSNATTS
jgi:hypothetical protein